jgi:hypothetical protein
MLYKAGSCHPAIVLPIALRGFEEKSGYHDTILHWRWGEKITQVWPLVLFKLKTWVMLYGS